MTEQEWTKVFVDHVLTFAGKDARDAAERAASDIIQINGLSDDPIGCATLTLEGWSYSS